MSSTVVSARGTRAKAIIGVLAAATLILFGAAPAWAVSYGSVTATATAAPTCTLSGKTYTCSVAGTGSYTGSNGSPASTVYLQVEVWRCPTTTSSIAVNGATPAGCTREANVQTASTVPANCVSVCIGSTKASGSATCTATAAYNYFTRSTLWLSTGAVASGTTALLKSAKGC
jgi:hypothetical protein